MITGRYYCYFCSRHLLSAASRIAIITVVKDELISTDFGERGHQAIVHLAEALTQAEAQGPSHIVMDGQRFDGGVWAQMMVAGFLTCVNHLYDVEPFVEAMLRRR